MNEASFCSMIQGKKPKPELASNLPVVPKRKARPVHENSLDKFRRSIVNNFGV